jgi:hypothetical protein
VSFPIFPVYLEAHRSGSADYEIQQLVMRLIDQLTSSGVIGLALVYVDGDPRYQSLFDDQFERLFPVLDLRLVLRSMHGFRTPQIGDFLRFLKSARTKIDCCPLDLQSAGIRFLLEGKCLAFSAGQHFSQIVARSVE